MTKEKFFGLLGWVGMVINCTLWLGYGLFKKDRDWPIVIANSPGLIFGFLAAFTSL